MRLDELWINIFLKYPALVAYYIMKWTFSAIKHVYQMEFKKREENIYGDAHWATKKEMKDEGLLNGNKTGLVLGKHKSKLITLPIESEWHMIVFAKTGAGKTSSLIIPQLLNNPDTSFVVIDVKGELEKITRRYREKCGDVYLIDQVEPERSDTFNPFLMFEYAKDENEQELVAEKIAQQIVPFDKGTKQSGSDTSVHFDESIHILLKGAVLFWSRTMLNGARLSALVDNMLSWESLEALTDEMKARGRDGQFIHSTPITSAADVYKKISQNERGSFHSTMLRHLSPYSSFASKVIGSPGKGKSVFFPDMMESDRPFTLYLKTNPDMLTAHGSFMRMIIGTALSTAFKMGGIKKKLVFLVDEADAIGYCADIEHAITKIRSYNISIAMVFQSLEQVQRNYRKHNTLIAQSKIWSILSVGNDLETLKHISELAGQRTVETFSASDSGERVSATKGETGRPLVTPDKLRRMKTGDVINFVEGMHPIQCKGAYYKSIKKWKRLWD